jgi:hypothetical protein
MVPVKVIAGAALMVRPSAALGALRAVAVPESVTLKVRLVVPAQEAFGVPEITPAEVIVRQAGNVPLVMLHVYGAMPPEAARACE